MEYDVFVSYRWVEPDMSWVQQCLVPALKEAGIRVCLDVEDFIPGRDLILEMNRAGTSSRHVICVLSPNYLEGNRMTSFEAMNARRLDPAGKESRLIPFILSPTSLPEWIRGLIPVNWTDPKLCDREWRKLLEVVEAPNLDVDPPETIASNVLRLSHSADCPTLNGMNSLSNERVELHPGEWMVSEAKECSEFFMQIRSLHDMIQCQMNNLGTEATIVITLYARSFPEKGVGKFEYDLIYYRNILNEAPMFGPLVKDDDRQKFMESSETKSIGIVRSVKPGGFADREKIQSVAKFKLTSGSHINGLLFVNGRNFPIPPSIFNEPEFNSKLSSLGKSVDEICISRLLKYNQRRGRLVGNSPNPFRPPISPNKIDAFFSDFVKKVAYITGHENLMISVYLYSGGKKKCLKWLWSNGPTDTCATVPLHRTPDPNGLLIADVAIDTNNKPLLLHNVSQDSPFNNKVVYTGVGNTPHANLVIPVLSDGGTLLLGVLDIQADDPLQFNTDDIQLLYALSSPALSDLMKRLQTYSKTKTLPLYNDKQYKSFEKRLPSFQVNELLELNFNPMKFLLHWKKVKVLITTGLTSAPATIEVWPSMKCNHKCVWCRTERGRRDFRKNRDEMTSAELMCIADDLASFGKIDILISGGGEPLLHPSIHEFMEKISHLDGTIGIFTNGTRPKNFRFWNHFFNRKNSHRFVRISFNGHDPESYFRTHFNEMDLAVLPGNHHEKYREARKIVLDLLGLRSPMTSIAIGETIRHCDLSYLDQKAHHAENIGVDFIQMRPELYESAQHPDRGFEICDAVQSIMEKYNKPDFSVIHTDAERSFKKHNETRCYAMQLVPTLLPDNEQGWMRIMPCSYAINNWGGPVPNLGRMREGARFSEFWKQMNLKLNGGKPNDSDYQVEIEGFINPVKAGCPQCRYFRLNQRVQEIEKRKDKLYLIDQLVDSLQNGQKSLDENLCKQIEEIWNRDTINLKLVRKAFEGSQKLNIIPSF